MYLFLGVTANGKEANNLKFHEKFSGAGISFTPPYASLPINKIF